MQIKLLTKCYCKGVGVLDAGQIADECENAKELVGAGFAEIVEEKLPPKVEKITTKAEPETKAENAK